jgi:hypothetical protein
MNTNYLASLVILTLNPLCCLLTDTKGLAKKLGTESTEYVLSKLLLSLVITRQQEVLKCHNNDVLKKSNKIPLIYLQMTSMFLVIKQLYILYVDYFVSTHIVTFCLGSS